MSKSLILGLILCSGGILYSAAPWAAGPDPSVREIYAAAEAGRMGQAEQMVEQVLKDNPGSGKAHYVAAEIYARAGDVARARSELGSAEHIDPGLPFANPTAVSKLQRELSESHTASGALATPQFLAPARVHEGLPWGAIIFAVLAIAVIWAFIRRRAAMSGYPYTGSVTPGPGQPGYGAPPMGGPMGGPYYPGGGGGSGLMGSLGTGLALGAGVAAGEELVHHVLDHNESGGLISNAGAGEREYAPPENSDMGGDNFGVNDASSWNDSNDAGSFDSSVGGDDWT